MARRGSIAEHVKELVSPIIAAEQLELVDVEFKHEGQTNYLRIFIDKPEGVTIDDCQKISRECEVVLDIEDVIQSRYVLEVSSPGLDRPLKTWNDYERFQDRLVKIKTFQGIHGRKKFLGRLRRITGETPTMPAMITIEIDPGEQVQIPYDNIASARLEVEF